MPLGSITVAWCALLAVLMSATGECHPHLSMTPYPPPTFLSPLDPPPPLALKPRTHSTKMPVQRWVHAGDPGPPPTPHCVTPCPPRQPGCCAGPAQCGWSATRGAPWWAPGSRGTRSLRVQGAEGRAAWGLVRGWGECGAGSRFHDGQVYLSRAGGRGAIRFHHGRMVRSPSCPDVSHRRVPPPSVHDPLPSPYLPFPPRSPAPPRPKAPHPLDKNACAKVGASWRPGGAALSPLRDALSSPPAWLLRRAGPGRDATSVSRSCTGPWGGMQGCKVADGQGSWRRAMQPPHLTLGGGGGMRHSLSLRNRTANDISRPMACPPITCLFPDPPSFCPARLALIGAPPTCRPRFTRQYCPCVPWKAAYSAGGR